MDPMEAIKQTYFQECDELLLAMEEGLIAMENGEADDELINAVFRSVHSIKGGGGAFGFEALVGFAHVFETVLDRVRSGDLAAEGEVVKVLLRAGDKLSDHVSAARDGSGSVQDADVKEELDGISGVSAEDEEAAEAELAALDFTPVILDIDSVPEPVPLSGDWKIRFAPHAELYANANEPFLFIRELKSLGPIEVVADISNLPDLQGIEPDQSYLAWDIVLHDCSDRAKIEEVFEFVTGDCDLEIREDTVETAPAVDVAAAPTDDSTAEAGPAPAEAASVEKKTAAAPPAAEMPKQTIRVDLDKVDRLVNLVGELVITQAMLSQRVFECNQARNTSVAAGLNELEHLLRELQESVMAIRTQPVKSVFQRMPRLVRELAAQTNKQVRLVLEGEGTEVDKTVIERLGEPLTHMIRNAIDHGLETTEDRLAAGKPAEGTVTLSAEHRGGRIIIEVADDGRGIDRVRVREKAVQKGLISVGANLSDEEIDNLIFLPGFSTAKEVSNISGRGVGLDVVRRNIVDLGGRVVIGSAVGKGSKFCLTLPLTLAVLDGMVVSVGDQTFVLPLSHIVESLLPKAADIKPFGVNKTLLNVRGAYVPLVRVGELLGVQGGQTDPAAGVVILVENEGIGRTALMVDAIVGQRQVVIKSFETNFRHIVGIAAATILGDGRVALILDIDGLIARCRDAANNSVNDLKLAIGA